MFTCFFCVEALLKLLGFGMDYFTDGWNYVDIFVVITSLVALIPYAC